MKFVNVTVLIIVLILLFGQLSWADVGYTVRDGETIADIAAKFHIDKSALIKANNLEDGSELEEGSKLIIPYFSTQYIDEDNQEDEQLQSEEIAPAEYEVKPADCLARISKSFDCTVEDICKLNNLDKDSVIYIGQILLIPKDERTSQGEKENEKKSVTGIISTEETSKFKKHFKVKVNADDIEGKNLLDLSEIDDCEVITDVTTTESDNDSSSVSKPKKVSVIKQDVKLPDKPAIIEESFTGIIEHIVVKNDTVSRMARKYKVSEDAIFKANKIDRHTILDIDDIIIIPCNPKSESKLEIPKKDDGLINRKLAKRDKLIRKALEYEGLKRRKGGSSLSKGVDCSGFTMRIFEKFGVKLPHSSREQALMGMKVKIEYLIPGDLVFFSASKKSKRINHVGIYIGDGYILHVSTISHRVKKDRLSSDYFSKHYVTARRYF